MDHMVIVTADGSGIQVSCLCGDFHHVVPIAVKSVTSLQVEYRLAHFNWTSRGFGFKGTFRYDDEHACGERIKPEHAGSIDSKAIMKALPAAVRNYYHEKCTWLLSSKVDRQLIIEMFTSEKKPCNVWNVTVVQYKSSGVQEKNVAISEDRMGKILHTFCPKHKKKVFRLPWRENNIFLKLSSLSNNPVEYSIRWKSITDKANVSVVTPPDHHQSRGNLSWNAENLAIFLSMSLLLQIVGMILR